MQYSPTDIQYRNGTAIPVAGILSKLQIKATITQAAGVGWVFTVQKNGTDTAMTVTLTENTVIASDSTNTVTVAAGDTIRIKAVPSGSPTLTGRFEHCIEFDGTVAANSFYAVKSGAEEGAPSTNFNLFCPVLASNAKWIALTDPGAPAHSYFGCAGIVTGYTVWGIAPLTGSYSCRILKNGVTQDGTGGTTDTRTTLSGGDGTTVRNSAAFSLTVAAGDRLEYEFVLTGSVGSSFPSISTVFQPTAIGDYQWSAVYPSDTFGASDTPNYPYLIGETILNNSNTEADTIALVPVSGFNIKGLYVRIATAAGAAKSRTFVTRKNSGNAAQAASVVISGAADLTGIDVTGKASFSDGDTIGTRQTGSGTPTASGAYQVVTIIGLTGGASGKSGGKKGPGGGLGGKTVFGPSLFLDWDSINSFGA
jgi:hypothetical protein